MVDEDEPPKLFPQGGRNGEPIPYLAIPYQQEVVKGRCAYGGFTVETRIRWCLDCPFNEQRDNPQPVFTVDLRGTQHDWRDEVPPESAVDDPRGALLATAHATSIFEYGNGSVSEGHCVDEVVTIHTLYLCDRVLQDLLYSRVVHGHRPGHVDRCRSSASLFARFASATTAENPMSEVSSEP